MMWPDPEAEQDGYVSAFAPVTSTSATNNATPIIVNNMLTADTGRALINAQRADAVSFGRAFIANPDLVARIRSGAQLAKPDYTKLYVGEEQGYTDYPALNIAVE